MHNTPDTQRMLDARDATLTKTGNAIIQNAADTIVDLGISPVHLMLVLVALNLVIQKEAARAAATLAAQLKLDETDKKKVAASLQLLLAGQAIVQKHIDNTVANN